jgi:peroxiredoxin
MLVRRWVPGVLGLVLLALSGLVLVLASRNRELSSEYQELRQLSTLPHRGTVVPTFRAVTLDGRPVIIGERVDSTARQVLFVFNTRCPFCLATIPAWQRLSDSLGRAGVEVLAISLDPGDSTRRYVSQYDMRYSVLTFPQPKLKRLYRAIAVPQTVVLDAGGTVLYAKTGTLDSASLDSVYAVVRRRTNR